MKTKHKFKVGDKVRLLPSIVTRCVLGSEIGEIGVITKITNWGSVCVKTDEYPGWLLREENISPVIKTGEQLSFDFMEEGE